MKNTLRARELGIAPGILSPGPLNAITDVDGVTVGQITLISGDDIRTGVTAILPHGGNLFQEKVPAGLAVGNGFGKMMGATQIQELGEIETPIVLTNTLAVPQAADALITWTLSQPGNEDVRSVNPVVGETNDGQLNAIRTRAVTAQHVLDALAAAKPGPVAEGGVGAGTGTVCFGWKGGIGTSSRRLPDGLGGWTVGVLVQSNYGGVLQILGTPVGQILGQHYLRGPNWTHLEVRGRLHHDRRGHRRAALRPQLGPAGPPGVDRAGPHGVSHEQRQRGLCAGLFHGLGRAPHPGPAGSPVLDHGLAQQPHLASIPGCDRSDRGSHLQFPLFSQNHNRGGRGQSGSPARGADFGDHPGLILG